MTDAPPLPARTTGPALRNTLSRRVEPVPLRDDGPVRMYTCGPTVYRWAHVGNLRSYLLADLIRRTFLYHGVPVLHVKNITDVGHLRDERFDRGEDRMLVAAGLESKTPAEIADAYEAGFHEDEALVNILPAHVFPRATEHVARHARPRGAPRGARPRLPVGLGQPLLRRRLVPRLRPAVGQHPRQPPGRATAADVEPDKRDAADFALWKAAGEGRILRWPSPWGDGFPGWHLECSAMALRYLGPGFEIHTGGIDNVFPHHEDEIAQSTPVVGGPPVRHWVHGEHLLASGRKMAKSTGNFERVTELRDRGIDPLAFRYLTLTVRYGAQAQLLAGVDRRPRRRRSARCAVAPRGAGPAAGRRPVGGAGPRCAPGPPDRARPAIADGVAGHQADAPRTRPTGPRSPTARAAADAPLSPAGLRAPRPLRRGDRRRPRPADGARGRARVAPAPDLPADERRWLVLDADLVLGLDLDRVWDAGADGGARAGRRPARRSAAALLERSGGAHGPHGTGPAPTRSATSWRRWASRSSTAPAGTTWRRRAP